MGPVRFVATTVFARALNAAELATFGPNPRAHLGKRVELVPVAQALPSGATAGTDELLVDVLAEELAHERLVVVRVLRQLRRLVKALIYRVERLCCVSHAPLSELSAAGEGKGVGEGLADCIRGCEEGMFLQLTSTGLGFVLVTWTRLTVTGQRGKGSNGAWEAEHLGLGGVDASLTSQCWQGEAARKIAAASRPCPPGGN